MQAGGALADAGDGEDVETRIYRAVFDSVMAQRLLPGTKLPEAALCELFGVSRSVVRKVLQKLAHDHIVQLRPNRGAIVAVPTPDETRQIFEARRALEAAIVTLVTQRATAADLRALRAQLQQEHQAVHRFDQPAWARLASTFHLRLAELAHNPLLQRYLVETVSRCSLIVALHEPPGNAACEHDEHERIVDCIARGDAAGAVALMDSHLRDLEQHLALDSHPQARSLGQLLGLG
jgi:DNA-binding GntR family transcriptional regulator